MGEKDYIIIPQDYYDTEFLITAYTGDKSFFTVPLGGTTGAIAKTKAETNMTLSGQLPAGFSFIIEGVKIQLLPLNASKVDFEGVMCKRAYFELFINQNSVLTVPLSDIPTGNGIYASANGEVAVGKFCLGIPEYKNVYKFGKGRKFIVNEGENFYANMSFREATVIAAPNTISMKVSLIGAVRRKSAIARGSK